MGVEGVKLVEQTIVLLSNGFVNAIELPGCVEVEGTAAFS
jgi:hypothetical protein